MKTLVVLIPLYNDWDSIALLLPELGAALAQTGVQATVLLVDDRSTMEAGGLHRPEGVEKLMVLRLRRNLGHQRAIAVGLCHIQEVIPCDAVLVMDGDGEDIPSHIPQLVEAFTAAAGKKVVFAARAKRSERLVFRVFYRLYRLIHFVLTGIRVRVGNFSLVPREALECLTIASELWNHYAAAIVKSRAPFSMVPLARGRRLAGHSTMNFTNLVTHGLSAISVFGDKVGVRLVCFSAALAALSLLGILAAVAILSSTLGS